MSVRTVFLPTFILAIGACGGSSNAPSDPENVSVDIAITDANAVEVSGAVMYAALNGESFAAENNLLVGAQTGDFSNRANVFSPSKLSTNLPDIPETTSSCEVTGTLTFSGRLASELTITAGDQINSIFNSCNDGEVTLNGTLNLGVTSFSGDASQGIFSLGLDMTFTGYSILTSEFTMDVDGRLSSFIDLNTSRMMTSVSSDLFNTVTDGREQRLINYTLSSTTHFDSDTFALETSGALDDERLGGLVSFETTESFTGMGIGYPSSGIMTIEGANGSTVTLTALSSIDVMLAIDSNGDNIIDETIMTNWNALAENIL